MKTRDLILSAAALTILYIPQARAQQAGASSGTASAGDHPAPIAQHKDNQQDRIAQGVQSGQLTAGETTKLESKEAGINMEEHTMRMDNNGRLTSADRARIYRQQNNLSHQIYTDKHNANTAHYGNNVVGQRRQKQQDRIAQGVRSGQLTAGETARLENQQRNINRAGASMRAANGGRLTPGDKAVLNRQQNRASRNIYAKKHNARRTRR